MLGNVVTALIVLAVVGLIAAVAGIIYVLARPKPPEPTFDEKLDAALAHPPEKGQRPCEIIRNTLVPKPPSPAELAALVAAQRAQAGNPSTPTGGASSTATPGATAPPA
jgi:hypothetical protein